MTWIWLGILIVLTLIEFSTKNIVMIFFAISALISMVLSLFISEFIIQFLVFIILGTILLITQRERLIKLKKDKNIARKKQKKVKKNEK